MRFHHYGGGILVLVGAMMLFHVGPLGWALYHLVRALSFLHLGHL